jgi:tetratricopeptide (TPR) repeat protein
VSAVREAIARVEVTTPIRRILTSVVDVMVACTATDMHALSPRLMAYGQALEYEAKWALAADVYGTIVVYTHPTEDADLTLAASLQCGYCFRTMGRLDDAATAYDRASQIAIAVDDTLGILRGRLGEAKVASARGNMPAAESILAEVLVEAKSRGFEDFQSRVLNDQAYVAGLRGQHDRAVGFSYEALALSKSQREKDRILTNIATGLRHLGLTETARDAYLVLAATAQEQFIRWNSELNLMELAAEFGNELQFDRLRRDLEQADFTPQLHAQYLMYVGKGYTSLGNFDCATSYLMEALEFASAEKLNQVVFEAEAALDEAKRERRKTITVAAYEVRESVSTVIDAIEDLKVAAGI